MQEMMNQGDIAFPHLGIYISDLPKSFTIFGFTVAFYGCIIGLGILGGVLMAVYMAKKTGQNPDIYWDFAIYAIIFSIIGARLYYVAFMWDNYKDNLLSIFYTRQGGLAIYGAVIAAFLTAAVYCKVKKMSALLLIDTGVAGLILGQAIGRWGNFMNREVFGEYTDNFLAMRLPEAAVRANDISESIRAHMTPGTNYVQVHPTFLYESLWNFLILALIIVYTKHKKFDGEIMLLYLAGYGIGRYFIEGIRTDTLFIPGTTLPVSQALAAVMVAVAVAVDVIVRLRLKKKQQNAA
ncbi:MAG: prolipoprotein diacylglyceryl transferase [Lachnospiraceae bacterium]|nr:prolipoprotein diacylglyceryl transferase [Lachnospiraceae bacterium]